MRKSKMKINYEIYQYSKEYLKQQEEQHKYPSFRSLEDLEKLGCEQPKQNHYVKIYEGSTETDEPVIVHRVLEQIYVKFNVGIHPENYHGHSVSTGDVVIFEDKRAFFCDDIGWTEITDSFFTNESDNNERMRIEYLNLLEEMFKVDGCESGKGWEKTEKKIRRLQSLVNDIRESDFRLGRN